MRIRKNNDIMDSEDIELIANCSDALAHPARVEIFRYIYSENLSRRTVCNKDLVAAFDYSQATISQHASKIAQSGLIDVQKKDNKTYYFVNIGVLGRYLNAVRKLNEV
ncbi:MAG: helix-turn-helix transcriptional regulator [Firmicutes bacterium]|jgi:DNA-binding transcriptional ArsR family regulator|nr:helix-turn-helix transcriptional regulator [Bacillota bacterium]MBR6351434.1 helix-turn-helix transcriptional regulator [Bacillota bacterium]